MSRFFAASSSGSGSSSSSSSDSETESIQRPQEPVRQKHQRNQYSSESEDDAKTAVVSQTDKLLAEVSASSRVVIEGVRGGDWVGCLEGFEGLKGKKYTGVLTNPPNVYVKALVLLEDGIKVALNDKIAVKKLNATVAKALNALNQKVRKHNVTLSDQILAYRENPLAFEDVKQDAADDSDDSVFGKESASDDSSSEDERQGLTGRNRWLKKVKVEKTNEELFAKNPKQRTQKAEKAQAFVEEKTAPSFVDITIDTLYKKLQQVLEARGKRGTDRLLQIQILRQLAVVAQTPYQKIKVLLTLIPAQFDFSTAAPFMQAAMWKDVLEDIEMLLVTVESFPMISISETAEAQDDDAENEKVLRSGKQLTLLGNIASYIDRLDQEFTKALQTLDFPEYLERLSQEKDLYQLFCHAQLYFAAPPTCNSIGEAMMMMCRLEHVYAKPAKFIALLESSVKKSAPFLSSLLSSTETVDTLATALYSPENERFRLKTILMHTTHHCIVSPFAKAKLMLLQSAIQDTIFTSEIPLQILYNRTLVHLALSAFTSGFLKEATGLLHELHYTGRVKQLLAQENTRYPRSLDQEKLDRTRQIPMHMHLNTDLLECIYLCSSMVLEMPVLVSWAWDQRRKFVGKPFRKFLEQQERHVVGEKGGYKEGVVSASRCMLAGDWRGAVECVLAIKVWDALSNAKELRAMLQSRVKEASLSTYLVMAAKNTEDISVTSVAEMFLMDASEVERKALEITERELITVITEQGYMRFEAPAGKLAYLAQQDALDVNGEAVEEKDEVEDEDDEVNY